MSDLQIAADQHALMVREKRRVAISSVIAAVFLTSMKLVVGVWTGSLGILSEAAHSGLDLLAALITFFAVSVSDRPADRDHQFGHGKVENISALAETLLLLITCAWILWEAGNRLIYGHGPIDVNAWSFIVIGISIVIDLGRSRVLFRIARKYHSQALEADALHFSTDIYSSLVVIAGLIFVQAGFPAGDSIAAACVAIIVIWISVRLGKSTIDVLLDRTPAGIHDTVHEAVSGVDGVSSIRSTRVRQSGAHMFVNLVIGLKRTLSFDKVHAIMDEVERAVHDAVPRSDVIVHAEPVLDHDEHVAESVRWLAQRMGLYPHNIFVMRSDGCINIDMDIEFAPGTTFDMAHSISATLEEKIHTEIPHIGHVCVHLEEERPSILEATNETGNESGLVASITKRLDEHAGITGYQTIDVFKSERGLKINIICTIDHSLSLDDSHNIVNDIESEILKLDPRITKVFIHAEPVKPAAEA
jgi:cation diffusion facilitator family transporter